MAFNREKTLAEAQKYIEKRKYDKAILELRRVVDADPNDSRSLHKIGELQAKLGQFAEAVDTYEAVARLYQQGGFAQRAVAVYKQIREILQAHPQLEPRYGHVGPKLVDLYRELGLTNDALVLLNELAGVYQYQQRHAEALEAYRKLAEIDSANPLAHVRLAEALSRSRDVDGAVLGFQNAARLLLELHRRDDAIQVLERLLHHRADPEQARVCAELYLSRQRSPQDGMQALAKLQICYQANPRDTNVLGLLARAFETVGQRDKAQEIHREIARLSGGRG